MTRADLPIPPDSSTGSEDQVVDSPPAEDDTRVDLRCSVVILKDGAVLLLHRNDADEWVLPGGRPRHGESMASCARREVREETGLVVDPGRCAFVLEVAAPDVATHIVELVFLAGSRIDELQLTHGEPGRRPQWVALHNLGGLTLRPPIAGHVRALSRDTRQTAPYLGNVWRPAPGGATADRPAGSRP